METQSAKLRKATQEMGGDPHFKIISTLPKGGMMFALATVLFGVIMVLVIVLAYSMSSDAPAPKPTIAAPDTGAESSWIAVQDDVPTVALQADVVEPDRLTL